MLTTQTFLSYKQIEQKSFRWNSKQKSVSSSPQQFMSRSSVEHFKKTIEWSKVKKIAWKDT